MQKYKKKMRKYKNIEFALARSVLEQQSYFHRLRIRCRSLIRELGHYSPKFFKNLLITTSGFTFTTVGAALWQLQA